MEASAINAARLDEKARLGSDMAGAKVAYYSLILLYFAITDLTDSGALSFRNLDEALSWANIRPAFILQLITRRSAGPEYIGV